MRTIQTTAWNNPRARDHKGDPAEHLGQLRAFPDQTVLTHKIAVIGEKDNYRILTQSPVTQKPDDTDAMAHWITELNKLKAALEKQFAVEITDEKLRRSIATMNKERSLRRQLAELMQADNPPLTGRQLLDFKSNISGICADFQQYEKAI